MSLRSLKPQTSNNCIPLDDLLAKQNQTRGFDYLPLRSVLLLQRIKDGGHSGQFLANAFLSCYRTDRPFQHSLGEIIKLDTEAIRLFHEILHIRLIKGWSDNALYSLEQEIIQLSELEL